MERGRIDMALTLAQHNCLYCGTLTTESEYCCNACEKLHQLTSPLPFVEQKKNPFSYLDAPEFRKLYFHQHSDFEYLFYVEGLHCSSCVHLLEKLPDFYDGVSFSRVNYAHSTLALTLRPGASLAQAAFVIKELGYSPLILSAQDNFAEKYKMENRRFLKRIGVAGFCAGNTMLFVIPVYAGLVGSLETVFNWMSFLLFLPILLYSAQPFYQGAINALKYKVINVDLPIVIAMLSGFILSTYNLVRGNGAIYFDSTASFMFFILSARYLLKRVQQNYLSPSLAKSIFKNQKYLKIVGSAEEVTPFAQIRAGDILKVQQGQILPSDCTLLSEHALLDMSLFNGESLPKNFTKGLLLFGGTQVLNTHILVQIQNSYEDSKMGQLIQKLEQGALDKGHFVALTDQLAQKLIITVFGIAILFFAFYSAVDFSEAFNRSLALIVLACPCALAFGTPLTFGLALKKAQSQGVLIKNATVFEKILKVKNIFFDKTGTLTEGQLALESSEPESIPHEVRQVILSLESSSYHPVAFALRKAWPTETLLEVTESSETLGQGVSGKINGVRYELRSLAESTHENETAIELLKEGRSLCRLYFTDSLRKEAPAALAVLKKRGLNMFLLSGDKKSRAQDIGQRCDIPKENIFAELFPEDKKQILEQYADTCMIGDGANDALALQLADVGIAVKGSVDLSLQHADVYFSRGGLNPLFTLLNLSERTQKVLVRNLSISLIYNITGGTLALLGFINPLMAAILMPISSALIILSTLWGFR
ncbi:putative copper-importing P-type ATPase A [compost metagenome]